MSRLFGLVNRLLVVMALIITLFTVLIALAASASVVLTLALLLILQMIRMADIFFRERIRSLSVPVIKMTLTVLVGTSFVAFAFQSTLATVKESLGRIVFVRRAIVVVPLSSLASHVSDSSMLR